MQFLEEAAPAPTSNKRRTKKSQVGVANVKSLGENEAAREGGMSLISLKAELRY